MTVRDFTHFTLDEEIQSISGHYCFQKEVRLTTDHGDILYYSGYSVTDSSCCGVGGCAFCFVPGFIKQWHYRNDNGLPVSEVMTVDEGDLRNTITDLIKNREMCTQVNFF